jgi:uncharacterized DUF497 family protein
MNQRKHGVSFTEALTVFNDLLHVVVGDAEHSDHENRYLAVGETEEGRVIVLSYTIRDDQPWPISARVAERRERRLYMDGDELRDEDEMLPYYDFSKGIRGLHYRGPRPPYVVQYAIDEDIAAYFPTDADVNNALRTIIAEGRAPLAKDCSGK